MAKMNITDARGLAVSASSSSVVEQFDAIIDDLYYYRLGVIDRLDALLRKHPELVLGHVLMGYSLMGEGASDAHPKARKRLQRAEALAANPRERLHIDALRAWLDQDDAAREAAWERILVDWPLDLLALRQHTGALFWTGAKRHQAEVMMGAAIHWTPDTPSYGHFLSAHAFALEEIGQYALAERFAREALEIEPQDLWALHGVAHVLEMQGRVDEGLELLDDAARFLDDYNLFRGHLWWHLSLFNLAKGRCDEALDLFDKEIYPKSSTFFLDIQNGASLLARLEFQGVDVGEARWQRLAKAAADVGTKCTLWFTAMHHVIALLRVGKESEAEAVIDYLHDEGQTSSQAALADKLSRAAAAFYRQRPREALAEMLALRQRHGELGASHAQQDLYDQIMVMSALQLDDWPRVRELLTGRLATRIWDPASWAAFERRAAEIAKVDDRDAVRAALRWAA